VAVVGLLAAAQSGCQPHSGDYFGTVRPRHGPDEYWTNLGAEPEWIDPSKCSDSNGGQVIFNTFAGLLANHPATLQPVYDVARDMKVSEDGLTYTFALRPTQWSDGRPLTAHDFVWSWRRLLDPATASKYGIMGYVIKNGEAVHRRAVYITGFPEPVEADIIQSWIPAEIPVERVAITNWPAAGAFVFVGGEGDAQLENRQKLIDSVNRQQLSGHAVQASIAGTELVAAEALDDLTVQLHLENPAPYILHLLSFYTFMPVPRHVIERLEKEGKNPDLWTRPEYFVSNGAYTLKEWRFRQFMRFEKNPHYWNAKAIQIGSVKALMVESYNTVLNLYRTGEIDSLGHNTPVPNEFVDHLRRYKDFHDDPYLGVYFYWINTKRPPLDNVLVRKALSLAIDRQSLCRYITRGGQIPSADLVPDGTSGYRGLGLPLFDPQQARRLLAEAGYPDGERLPPVTLIYNTSEGHKQIAEAIQQMWRKHLGIHVQIINREWKVYLKDLAMTDFDIARMGWIGDYPDPNTFIELLSGNNGNNHSNWSSPEFDDLLRQSRQTRDLDKRLDLMRQAEVLALDQQPLIPIYVYTRTQMVKPYVRGFWPNILDRHPWKYLSIDQRWYDGVPEHIPEDLPPELPLVE
jgi:oligopeptide transport system substrate-binding protein